MRRKAGARQGGQRGGPKHSRATPKQQDNNANGPKWAHGAPNQPIITTPNTQTSYIDFKIENDGLWPSAGGNMLMLVIYVTESSLKQPPYENAHLHVLAAFRKLFGLAPRAKRAKCDNKSCLVSKDTFWRTVVSQARGCAKIADACAQGVLNQRSKDNVEEGSWQKTAFTSFLVGF